MQLFDLHLHTIYSDGEDSPEEMILSAISKGLIKIGISDHSYTEFDNSYCMGLDNYNNYVKEIKSLKNKYKDKIEVNCGIEQDYYSIYNNDMFDYVIGSVHYLLINNNYCPIDLSYESLLMIINNYFEGDAKSFISYYFEVVCDMVFKMRPDIIGHFEIIKKFNINNSIFDENAKWYQDICTNTIDRIYSDFDYTPIFEINTNLSSRRHNIDSYLSAFNIDYIKKKGGKLILSSDSHNINNISQYFSYFEI